MNAKSVVGPVSILIGALLLTQHAARAYRRDRDEHFARFPRLRRLPGGGALYSDRGQNVVRVVVATGFLVFGILVLAGVLELS